MDLAEVSKEHQSQIDLYGYVAVIDPAIKTRFEENPLIFHETVSIQTVKTYAKHPVIKVLDYKAQRLNQHDLNSLLSLKCRTITNRNESQFSKSNQHHSTKTFKSDYLVTGSLDEESDASVGMPRMYLHPGGRLFMTYTHYLDIHPNCGGASFTLHILQVRMMTEYSSWFITSLDVSQEVLDDVARGQQ